MIIGSPLVKSQEQLEFIKFVEEMSKRDEPFFGNYHEAFLEHKRRLQELGPQKGLEAFQ